MQVSAERDLSNEANVALKAELERYRDVTGNTVEALEREKAVKAQLENQNKAQVRAVPSMLTVNAQALFRSKHAGCGVYDNPEPVCSKRQTGVSCKEWGQAARCSLDY